jgi:histidine kinase
LGQHGFEILFKVYEIFRLDEASIKSVDIHEGIESTLTILQQKLVGIRVIKKYTQLPKIYCYAAEINQVLMSLFTNSIDALSERQNREKLSIRIITELREDTIAIRVADNGIGMADEIVSKIFDPFFTTKAVGKGTGLGLAIAYQIIVDKHGGKLLCNSVPGKGTEFTILLPHH